MIPFMPAFNAFLIIYTNLPLAMKNFFVLALMFTVLFGAIRTFLDTV